MNEIARDSQDPSGKDRSLESEDKTVGGNASEIEKVLRDTLPSEEYDDATIQKAIKHVERIDKESPEERANRFDKRVLEYKEELKESSLEDLATALNNAECDSYSSHPLKHAIGELLKERYPEKDGWKVFKGNNGYVDSWTRTSSSKQISVGCEEIEKDKFVWYGLSLEK